MISIRQLPLALFALAAFAAPVSGQETQVFPPQGAYPHDSRPRRDGLVLGPAQGRPRNPRPGHSLSREVKLGPKSAPHGVIQGPDGAAWLTDSGLNAIVRVDPSSQEVNVWKLPQDTGYANLNTAVFDKDGIHWFPGQNALWSAQSKDRRDEGLKPPARPGSIRHHGNLEGDVYYASHRRQPHRPDRQDDRRGDRDRAADAGAGRPPGVVGLEGPHLGLGVECRSARALRSEDERLARMEAARRQAPGLRGLCRRARHRLSRTGARTRSSPSIPKRRHSRAIRTPNPTPTCARSSAGPARSGCWNPAPRGSW